MAIKGQSLMRRLFNNNKFVILFSLIAALIFWMVITVNESGDAENTISGINVTIPTENSVISELGLDVISDLTNLKSAVTVKGPAYVISNLTQNDIAVTASLSNVNAAGTYELELKATKQASNLNNEFEISSLNPSTVTVTFDFIDTKSFTVTPNAVGAAAIEGLVAENPVVNDTNNATLNFKGARTNIGKIEKIVAVAQVNKTLETTETFDAELEIYGANGEKLPMENYTVTTADGLNPPDVKITVPISKIKSVPVKAQFLNTPAAFSSKAISHTVSESSIAVIGPPETVDAIDFVSLEPIDFDGIDANDKSFEAKLVLPDGVRSVDNIAALTVKIKGLDNYGTSVYSVSSITPSTVNTASVKLLRSIRNVKLFGPKSVLKNISSSDLYAKLDVTGKEAGQHTVTARIYCKKSGEVWQIGSYTASVEIK